MAFGTTEIADESAESITLTVTFVKLGDVTGFTSHAVPFHIHESDPLVNVWFSVGLLGKFIAIVISQCNYLAKIKDRRSS
jgi:hypothetical protein